MNDWMQGIVDEMIEAGLVEEVEPGVVQKLDGHGWKMEYGSMVPPVGNLEEIDRREFKIALLAIMEAPHIMGVRIEEER